MITAHMLYAETERLYPNSQPMPLIWLCEKRVYFSCEMPNAKRSNNTTMYLHIALVFNIKRESLVMMIV
jgi:hypothetical protein